MADTIHEVQVKAALEQDDLLQAISARTDDAPVDAFVEDAIQHNDGEALVDSVKRAAALAVLEQLGRARDMAAAQVREEANWIAKVDPSTIRSVTAVDVAQARALVEEEKKAEENPNAAEP